MRIWQISDSPYKSMFIDGSVTFGDINPIFLIDQYSGKRPALINEEFLANGKIDIKMYPSALLDSNVMDAFNKRIRRNQRSDGVDGLLMFLANRNWDSSPLFYYLEYFAKSNLCDFISFASEKTESLIKIHAMDNAHFIDTGDVIVSEEAVHHYTSEIGVKSLYEVARYRVEKFSKEHNKDGLVSMVEAIKIALIKMVMIDKFELASSSPEIKLEEFVRFLKRDLGIFLAREAHLALHYFCGAAGSLLGIQKNTNSEKISRIINSTAWDMYLVRFQDILFSYEDELCVGYMVTGEKNLYGLAKLYAIDHIIQRPGHGFTPAISYNMENIPSSVADAVMSRRADSESPSRLPDHVLKLPVGLFDALHRELVRACDG